MQKQKFILIRGLPGSGKSTFAKSLMHALANHFEADQYFIAEDGSYNFDTSKIGRAHEWCRAMTKKSLEDGFDTFVSNTFTTKKELRPYFELGYEYNIIPTVVTMNGGFTNIHDVPSETLVKMKNRFEHDITDLYTIFNEK